VYSKVVVAVAVPWRPLFRAVSGLH